MWNKDEAKVDALLFIADSFGRSRKKECKFLDYKTPDGVRMENPIKPTSFA